MNGDFSIQRNLRVKKVCVCECVIGEAVDERQR